MWSLLVKFDNVEVHKDVLARWHGDVIQKIIKERLSRVVRAYCYYSWVYTILSIILFYSNIAKGLSFLASWIPKAVYMDLSQMHLWTASCRVLSTWCVLFTATLL